MGFLDKIFGEEPKVETKQTMSPEQRKILNEQLIPYFESLGPLGSTMGPEYEGEFTTGLGDVEQLSLSAMEDYAKSLVGGTSDLRKTGEQTLMDIMQGGPSDFEEYYRTGVQEPMLREFEEDIMPRISRRYAGSGFWGTERVGADESAREDLLDALTQSRAEFGYKSRESALNRAMTGAGKVPGYDYTALDPLTSIMEAGGVERGVEQLELDRLYQDFLRRAGSKDIAIQQMLAALGIQTQQAIVNPGSSGLVGAIAPATKAFF